MAVVLIPDTSALLDLIRAPVRREFHPTYGAAVPQLLAAAQANPPTVRILCPDLVQHEYHENAQKVTDDTVGLLTKARDDYRHALQVIAGIGVENVGPWASDQWIEEAVRRTRVLADTVLGIAHIEGATEDDHRGAMHRVFNRIPPSAQGKESLADCTITEVALRLARSAYGGGPMHTVFMSSNTRDYCEGGGLKARLQVEFEECGLLYVRNWGEARAVILPAP